jgi:hypothetical protein
MPKDPPRDTEEPTERLKVAERLRRVRETVRERALLDTDTSAGLPPPRPTREPQAVASEPEPPGPVAPQRPDGTAVNALWEARPQRELSGLRGRLARWLAQLLAPQLEAQVSFNSKQVQLDNQVLDYVDARLAATHRHYDGVLGRYGRHMGEIDERHLILQEELVAHVHDLVERIDLVLAEGEKGRLGFEHALRDLRARLARLEDRLERR